MKDLILQLCNIRYVHIHVAMMSTVRVAGFRGSGSSDSCNKSKELVDPKQIDFASGIGTRLQGLRGLHSPEPREEHQDTKADPSLCLFMPQRISKESSVSSNLVFCGAPWD